jgi:hypothetical protein
MKNIIWITLLLCCNMVFAQQADSFTTESKGIFHFLKKEEYGKNIIRYNIMPTALFEESRNASFGYERVTVHNQSASINAGFLFLPFLLDRSIGAVDVNVTKNIGFIGGVDYRFYLKNHNKRPAPNGVYIGPFYTIYNYSSGSTFTYVDNSNSSIVNYQATFASSFTLHNLGFELGYQFIFFKRLTLDMILFGPAISKYNIELDLQSNMSPDKQDEIYQKYYDSFFSKYPIFNELIQRGNFKRSRSSVGLIPNFRYTFQIGWHF